MGLLVRPRAWWYNKVPLSVTLVLLLIDGQRLDLGLALVLPLVVLTVCAVGNFGYAVNDLFDIEEDSRAGRPNDAARLGRRRTTLIIGGSALLAVVLGWSAAGIGGAVLTALVLVQPLVYSVPPLRIKERRWLGVGADALAAHVYPALLAILAVEHLGSVRVSDPARLAIVVWSVAVGLRGILSHQLATAERDRAAGLTTVVHQYGRQAIERLTVFVLLPAEAIAFLGALVFADCGPVLWAFVAIYAAVELFKTFDGRSTVRAFRPEGQRYVPLVEENLYKAWCPIVLAVDAARVSPIVLIVVPAYYLLFRPHLRAEADRLTAVARAFSSLRSRPS